jgi:hypothetical protein
MDWGIDKKILKSMLIVGIVAISLLTLVSAVILTNNSADSDQGIIKDNFSPEPNSTINNSFNQSNDQHARTSLSYSNKHQSTIKNTTKIIDYGSSSGYDNIYWDSNYVNSWKTYTYGTSKVKIFAKWTFTDIKNTKKNKIIQQTIIIREDPENKGMAFVEITPKMSGKSGWVTWTSMQKNKNAVNFYWNAFRKTGLLNGFWS